MSDTSDAGATDNTMPPVRDEEVKYIAFVQISGIYNPDAEKPEPPVLCESFWNHLDAVRWVRGHVESAHEEVAIITESFLPISYYREGELFRIKRFMWTILSSGGPTWGMVIDVADVSFESVDVHL